MVAIILLAVAPPAHAKATEHWSSSKIKLFNTMEFRGKLKSVPKWRNVLSQAQKQVDKLTKCELSKDDCPPAAKSWQLMLKEAAKKKPLEQLNLVNRFANNWPYRLDVDIYGVEDYWATPFEFFKNSGDCEDYSITKYYALKTIGFPIEDMRVVVLRDTIRNLAHAVLAVYLSGKIYILDNIGNVIMPHTRFSHYLPQYSVNEQYRWAHVKVKRAVPALTLTRKRRKGAN